MIRTDLLRQLAEHLLHGELGHKVFDFSVYNEGFATPTACGTAGCAMGELPILFPDQWEFSCGEVVSKKGWSNPVNDGMDFFAINEEMYQHLFISLSQNKRWGPTLWSRATKEQVAQNILTFCELAENNKL